MIIELEKQSDFAVRYNGQDLPIVDRNKASGPSVDLGKLGLEGYQRYIKTSTMRVGINEVELKPKRITEIAKISYTEEEKAELAQLEARINEIKENAKKRIPAKKKRLEDMTIEELEEYIKVRKEQ